MRELILLGVFIAIAVFGYYAVSKLDGFMSSVRREAKLADEDIRRKEHYVRGRALHCARWTRTRAKRCVAPGSYIFWKRSSRLNGQVLCPDSRELLC